MKLIRPIVRVGNSAGVILPREWLNGSARIELIAKPLDVKKEVFEILDEYLPDIVGIYLIGSYARGEENPESDIDILAITNETNTNINKGKYNIILISKDKVENALDKNASPILPMVKEAKSLLNEGLIKKYSETRLTRKNLAWHIKGTKSILNISRADINLARERSSNCSDASAYSLVLRLRGIYIVDCLRKGKPWSNKELLRLIKTITGSVKAYEGYLRVKNNEKLKEDFPIDEAETLYSYILAEINKQEKWLKRKN